MTGAARIWGLGMGPGDPELITMKALRILKSVPVVAFPAPTGADSLVRRIAAPHLNGQREIVIATPMVAERYPAQDVYDWAQEEIAREVKSGNSVAVMCQGDPFFYGSFMYLFARLAENWPVEVIPGVSSLAASSAVLGLPLAARNDVVTVVPATLDEAALKARIKNTDAAVIMKVGRHLAKVRRVLDELGLAANARYVERATMDTQKSGPLTDITTDEAPYFSIILVRPSGEATHVD